jgi:hypothetical protein
MFDGPSSFTRLGVRASFFVTGGGKLQKNPAGAKKQLKEVKICFIIRDVSTM